MGTGIHAKDRIGVERVLLGVWMVVVSMRSVDGSGFNEVRKWYYSNKCKWYYSNKECDGC